MKNANILDIPAEEMPLRFERIKEVLGKVYGLKWTDFIVLCELNKLEKDNDFIITNDVVKNIGRNRSWVYSSLRRLRDHGLVSVEAGSKVFIPGLVSITGLGTLLLRRTFRNMKNDTYGYL